MYFVQQLSKAMLSKMLAVRRGKQLVARKQKGAHPK
jgi:hypothetical protein